MVPTWLNMTIMLPGLKCADTREDLTLAAILDADNVEADNVELSISFDNDFGSVLNQAQVFYSVERNKILKAGEFDVDSEDKLRETILCFVSMTELVPYVTNRGGPWLADFMAEGSHDAIDAANMAAIYDDIVDMFTAGSGSWRVDNPVIEVGFIGLWSIESSTEWETGHAEIDAINYAGAGSAVFQSADTQDPKS